MHHSQKSENNSHMPEMEKEKNMNNPFSKADVDGFFFWEGEDWLARYGTA